MNEDLEEYFDYDSIVRRMLDKVPNSIDKREGSIIYDAISPVAAELAQMYIVLKYNIDLVFVDTAVEQYLDKLCNQIGLARKQTTYAIRKGEFKDENNNYIKIESGKRFTLQDLSYVTKEETSLGIYKMECETPGTIGNKVFGQLIPIDYIEGLSVAQLSDILIPGQETETDEELRKRYFETINERTFAGNIADYKKKVKEINGIGAVRVTPAWKGGGTVELTILDSQLNKASTELIELVQENICPQYKDDGIGLAPIRTFCYC